ncbi:iron-sulfur cluster scaffold protein [Buchnera aphidicola (Cinara tujafilina)]|uniref:Fe/S biogenesis protein NfuA n=1 Tax=Buchnera aphidicola (Cinara tujafilina) TaxID=261317 RepID=F7WZQ4_9GAMM|nr:NifU family protein [Buchnera aphidicola]AEH39930.1 iron-sulfur cluster scaffold protein [Buchnera aphidicola (Cinara tujafilina)]
MITFSSAVQEYIRELISTQVDLIGIRIFMKFPGTIRAECGMKYCFSGDIDPVSDKKISYKYFDLYICRSILIFLKDVKVDLLENNLEKKNYIKCAVFKIFKLLNKKLSLEDKIQYYLIQNINPQLSLHGGKVLFIKITKTKYVLLKFLGSCNGCSMIDLTIKDGIEKKLLKEFPQIAGVQDITNHKHGIHSYS